MQTGWLDNHRCLVCGQENAQGLHLHFHTGEDGAEAEGMVPPHLQGYEGRAHGGVIAAILDDAMFYAITARGLMGVTAEMKVRYRSPLDTDRPFRVVAQCTRINRRFGEARATLYSGDQVVAESEAIFMPGK